MLHFISSSLHPGNKTSFKVKYIKANTFRAILSSEELNFVENSFLGNFPIYQNYIFSNVQPKLNLHIKYVAQARLLQWRSFHTHEREYTEYIRT